MTQRDTAGLETYLTDRLGTEIERTKILSDGLNLIVEISAVTDDETYILRHPNRLREAEYIASLREEYQVMQRLEPTPVPIPDPVLFCEDESVLGGPFFLMEHLPGEPLETTLPAQFQRPRTREQLGTTLIDTLAGIHSLDTDQFEGVCPRQTPREQIEVLLDRLESITSVTDRSVPRLWSVAEWLRENAPEETTVTLTHGDYRPANIHVTRGERMEMSGVFDWETAMLADPGIDLGYLLFRWNDSREKSVSLDLLEDRYDDRAVLDDIRKKNTEGFIPFSARPGSPTRRELLARYERQTGISFENQRFFRAQAAFGLAVVWEDLHRSCVEAGEASDWPPYVDFLAVLAESITSGDRPL